MPKEQVRKRGRRKPKQEVEQPANIEGEHRAPQRIKAGPSGLHPSRAALIAGPHSSTPHIPPRSPEADHSLEWQRGSRSDSDFPFGVLDPDLKAYFRNVEERIRDWEGVLSAGEEREDRQLFLDSVLKELRGFELQVATDPDCAIVLERLLPSLGDWGRRVIGDAFGDGWDQVVRHRFGSHVAQTWFSLAADTLDREAKGIFPPQHHAQLLKATDAGVLPTMTTLVSGVIASLSPTFPILFTHPHASPPIRLLMLVITPGRSLPRMDAESGKDSLIRSKKSSRFRKGHGVQGKSILGEEEGKGKEKEVRREVPVELAAKTKNIRGELMRALTGVEWRVMGTHPVGSAAVQLLVQLEAEEGEAMLEGSLLDHLTEGLVEHLRTSSKTPPPKQTYFQSLLSATTGTHLAEVILLHSPSPVFQLLWTTYIEGEISRLAVHPFANFVIAKGVSRLDREGLNGVVRECSGLDGGQGLIKTARTSVLQALVDRAGQLEECHEPILRLIASALDLPEGKRISLVPCLMALRIYPTYQALLNGRSPPNETVTIAADSVDTQAEEAAAAAARLEAWKNRRHAKQDAGKLAPSIQGCLLLQGLVKLPFANEVVLDSLLKHEITSTLEYAKHPIASHFLDAALTSPTIPLKYRKRLISLFMGHISELAQDRQGSRVADTIWAAADGYMRGKIARSLIPEATTLGNSEYGRFFVRKLDLWGLDKRPEEWREAQLGVKARPSRTSVPMKASSSDPGNGVVDGVNGRNREPEDEIDVLFSGMDKKKRRKV